VAEALEQQRQRLRIIATARCAWAAAETIRRESPLSAAIQFCKYAAAFRSTDSLAMPVCPQRKAAPHSAINSSFEYCSEPKRSKLATPGRFRRDGWPVLCTLCRYRHKVQNAASRIMPRCMTKPLESKSIQRGCRYNYSDSRNASRASSGRYRPGFESGVATRASAFSLSRMSAWT